MSKISRSVLSKKCDVRGELIPIDQMTQDQQAPQVEKVNEKPQSPERPKKIKIRPLTPSSDSESSPSPVARPPPPSKIKIRPLTPSSDSESSSSQVIPAGNFCMCFVKSKNGPCGRPIKEDGRCGLHKLPKKCEIIEQKKEAKRPREKINEKCPCQTTSRTGEKKICGRKIKENGVCGIHSKKCNIPEIKKRLSPEIQEIPLVGKFEIKEEPIQDICRCIIKSKKKGVADRECGRKAKVNGHCGFHAPPRKCISPEKLDSPERKNKKKSPVAPRPVPIQKKEVIELKEEEVFEPEREEEEEEVFEPEQEEDLKREIWTFQNAKSLTSVYDYLTKIPAESIDIGDAKIMQDSILFYLRK